MSFRQKRCCFEQGAAASAASACVLLPKQFLGHGLCAFPFCGHLLTLVNKGSWSLVTRTVLYNLTISSEQTITGLRYPIGRPRLSAVALGDLRKRNVFLLLHPFRTLVFLHFTKSRLSFRSHLVTPPLYFKFSVTVLCVSGMG